MDAQARAVLDRLKTLAPETAADADDAAWLAGFRYQTGLLRTFSGTAEPLDSVSLATFGGVACRVFGGLADETPVLLHVHGGGGVAGTLDTYDPALRLLAARTGWTVVAPDYRLAPEHRFPAQLDDCMAALTALAGGERRVVVSGDSIGGTIATAMTIRARDEGGPAIAGQMLFYPNTDLRRGADYPSREGEDGNIIALDDLERQIRLYVADEAARSDPLASPILAPDLAGLPAAFVATCGCDPLRDEGEAYARRLQRAGIAVTHCTMPKAIHALLQMAGAMDATELLLTDARTWLSAL